MFNDLFSSFKKQYSESRSLERDVCEISASTEETYDSEVEYFSANLNFSTPDPTFADHVEIFEPAESVPTLKLKTRVDTTEHVSSEAVETSPVELPAFHLKNNIPFQSHTKIEATLNFLDLRDTDFEHWCSELLKRMGYTTQLTSRVNDKGLDIIATKTITSLKNEFLYNQVVVCQCKGYNLVNQVGSPEIRNFLGSMVLAKVRKGYFLTNSNFTPEAKKDAEKALELGYEIHLFDSEVLARLSCV